MAVAAFRPRREPRALWLSFLAAVSLHAAVPARAAAAAPRAGSASPRSHAVVPKATPAAGLPVVLARETCVAAWPASALQVRDPRRQGDVATTPGVAWVLSAAPPEPGFADNVPVMPASVPPRDRRDDSTPGDLEHTTLSRLPLSGGGAGSAPAASATTTVGPPGISPALAALADGSLIAATLHRGSAGEEVQVFRSNDEGRTWQDAGVVLRGHELGVGRFACGGTGSLWLPVLEGNVGLPTLHVLMSPDGGTNWRTVARLSPPVAIHGAEIAVLADGRLVCIARHGKEILAARSGDGGVAWSPFKATSVQSAADAVLAAVGTRATLLYTELPADTTFARPHLPMLGQAVSEDGGATWRRAPAILVHPGWVPRALGVTADAHGVTTLTGEFSAARAQFACRTWPAAPARSAGAARGSSAVDSLAAQRALRILAEYTAARPRRAGRLFVEAYFMRTLAAAHEVLGPRGQGNVEPFNSQRGLDRAIAFADTLLVLQDKFGFWPLGYHAVWYADMGAAAAIFPAVEPHVDGARLQRYEAATDRFLRGLAREKMLLDSGAVGLGREIIDDPLRRPQRASAEPYLVSTALVGIEIRAWMYHRTQRPEYREAALKSLDYTLSQITPDGFREVQANKEGTLRTVAYIQEGWMAADRYLDDPSVLPKLRSALRPHVAWLLSLQKPDGTWDGKGEGAFARTPGIVNFLVWYSRRCEPRADVSAAIARAAATWVNPDGWAAAGLLRSGEHFEVQRALLGRTLAALASGRPTP